MAVALQRHQLVHVHRAELGHPAHVVAGEVHQHDVLGDLLRVLLQLGGHAPVVLVGAAAAAGAGDRTADDGAAEHLHHRLGRGPGDGDALVAQEVHVRAGVHLAEDAVEIERVGLEVDVEALRQDHLEDVAGQDVLLGHLHGPLVHAVGHRAANLGRGLPGHGRFGQWHHQRLGQLRRRGPDAFARLVVLAVHVRPGHVQDGDALDQVDPLAPVVEGGHRADDAHHRIRQAAVVVGHVRQVLHLADDVVAEVAHHPALQRREVRHDGRVVGGDDGVQRGEHPLVVRDVGAEVLAALGDDAVAQFQRGHGVVADEAVAGPPFAVLHRLEQEALAVAAELEEGADRGVQVAQHLGPDRHHRVVGGQAVELLAAGPHPEVHHDPKAR